MSKDVKSVKKIPSDVKCKSFEEGYGAVDILRRDSRNDLKILALASYLAAYRTNTVPLPPHEHAFEKELLDIVRLARASIGGTCTLLCPDFSDGTPALNLSQLCSVPWEITRALINQEKIATYLTSELGIFAPEASPAFLEQQAVLCINAFMAFRCFHSRTLRLFDEDLEREFVATNTIITPFDPQLVLGRVNLDLNKPKPPALAITLQLWYFLVHSHLIAAHCGVHLTHDGAITPTAQQLLDLRTVFSSNLTACKRDLSPDAVITREIEFDVEVVNRAISGLLEYDDLGRGNIESGDGPPETYDQGNDWHILLTKFSTFGLDIVLPTVNGHIKRTIAKDVLVVQAKDYLLAG